MIFWHRTASHTLVSERFAGYQLIKLIHQGRKSTVYQARYGQTERLCALKVYNPPYEREVRRLRAEYRLPSEGEVGRLMNAPSGMDPREHPIVQTLDFGQEYGHSEGAHYVVLEYIVGHNLKNLIVAHHPQVRAHAREILMRVLDGLGFIHARGFIHRDFCADNVMVARGWRAKIIDLGFACPVGQRFGFRAGTPTYMAPEQFLREPLTAATDIYSLGVVAYELWTGRAPFLSTYPADDAAAAEKRTRELMEQHLKTLPPPPRQLVPDLSPAIERWLLRCLAKEPAARYSSTGEARAALAAALTSS